jgi:hypothetical protein
MTTSHDHADVPEDLDRPQRRLGQYARWLGTGVVIAVVMAAVAGLTYALTEFGRLGYLPLLVGAIVATIVLATHGTSGAVWLLGASVSVLIISCAAPSLRDMGVVVLSDDAARFVGALRDSAAGLGAGTLAAFALQILLGPSTDKKPARR